MSTAHDWNWSVVENGFNMYIAEIGDSTDTEIQNAIYQAQSDFGEVESVLYLIANNTEAQKELVVDNLGLDWTSVYMPWLVVLEDHPKEVEEGDKAIVFRLGKLNAEQIKEVTNKLAVASHEADALQQLTWEQRKEEFKDKIPVLKETAKMVISVAGVA